MDLIVRIVRTFEACVTLGKAVDFCTFFALHA